MPNYFHCLPTSVPEDSGSCPLREVGQPAVLSGEEINSTATAQLDREIRGGEAAVVSDSATF